MTTIFGSFSHSNFYEFYNAMKTLWQNIYNFFNNIVHGIGGMGKQSLSNCRETSRKEKKQSLPVLFVMNKILSLAIKKPAGS